MNYLRVFAVGLAVLAILTTGMSLGAQQLEVNDPGGSLTNAGTNPTVGTPFVVNLTSTFSPRVSGSVPNSGFIFAGGFNLGYSTCFPILDNQKWDLDPPCTVIIGDGISFTTPLAFLYTLNANSVNNFSFTANSTLNGLNYAFQAITVDPTHTLGLNLTALIEYSFTNSLSFSGDDVTQVFLPTTGHIFYGNTYTALSVCSNGFVRFGNFTSTDLTETVPEFLNGTPGSTTGVGTPVIAVDWEDLDLGNTPAARVTVVETAPRVTVIKWMNGEYFPTSPIWGEITLTVDTCGLTPVVTMDYTSYVNFGTPLEGLFGISDGQVGGAGVGPDIGADLVVAGVVSAYGPSGVNFVSYFQNFDGTGGFGNPAASPVDVGGTIINWIDATGLGDWFIF